MTILPHSLEKTGKAAVEGGAVSYRLYVPHNRKKAAHIPLIVAHGGPGSSHLKMYSALHTLANDRPVLFYDQLGSHLSPANVTADLMRLDRFADEVYQLTKALSFDKCLLLGQSWGAAVMTAFALVHPEKVAGLVLSGPHLSTPRWIADCKRLLAGLPQDIQDTIRRCEAEGTTDSDAYKAADEFFSKKHFMRRDYDSDWGSSHVGKSNKKIYMEMWGPSEFTCTGSLKDMDLFPRLHEISAPALLICGEFDTAAPGTVREAAMLMQNARVEVIPDSGHVSYGDSNALYLKSVQNFLCAFDSRG